MEVHYTVKGPSYGDELTWPDYAPKHLVFQCFSPHYYRSPKFNLNLKADFLVLNFAELANNKSFTNSLQYFTIFSQSQTKQNWQAYIE